MEAHVMLVLRETPFLDTAVLGPLSDVSPDTVVAVNASIWQRAPTVGEFLLRYKWDGEAMKKESASIRGGRIAMGANTIGLKFIKNQEAVWSQRIAAPAVTDIKAAVVENNVSLCREFEVRREGIQIRVCKDDLKNSRV